MTPDIDSIEFHGATSYFEEIDTLVLSDLHVGLEEAVQEGGVSMPLHESETLENDMRDAVIEFDPARVVFNGDVHHSFGKLGSAPETIKNLKDVAESEDAETVFIEGNHDTMLDSVVTTVKAFEDKGVVFVHGDEIPASLPDGDLYVVGHDHPSIEIEMEKRRCFIYGSKVFNGSDVLMTPAFNPLCSGVVINRMSSRDFMSPFIRGDFGGYRVVVEDEDGEPLRFPELSEFKKML